MQKTHETFYCESTFTFDFDFELEKKSDDELHFLDLEIETPDCPLQNTEFIIQTKETENSELNKKSCKYYKQLDPKGYKSITKVLFA